MGRTAVPYMEGTLFTLAKIHNANAKPEKCVETFVLLRAKKLFDILERYSSLIKLK